MQSPRLWIRGLTAGLVAFGLLAGSVLADELIGRIKSVDVEGKKIIITEKDTDKDVEITIVEETELLTPKGETRKVDLEKMKQGLEKSKRGRNVQVTHKDGVASKIEIKKGEPKKEGDAPKPAPKDEPKS